MKQYYRSDDPIFSKLDRKTNLAKLSEPKPINNESNIDLYFQIFIDSASHRVEIHIVELDKAENDNQYRSLIHLSTVQATLIINCLAAYHLRELIDKSMKAPDKIFFISIDKHQIKMERINEGFSFRLKGHELFRFTNAESLQSFMTQLIEQIEKSTDYEAQINAPRTDLDDLHTNPSSVTNFPQTPRRKPKRNLMDLYNQISNENPSDS